MFFNSLFTSEKNAFKKYSAVNNDRRFVRIRENNRIAHITKIRRYSMLDSTKKDMILYNRIRYQIGGREVI
ncbi:hypothetical protein IMSAGC013_04594 [Lachnospiraceae bacterium]|jgi:hypothetical protein|nr:hypothetical protein IMSAGC013_04594 [Lachnospiraceae bacterium]